MLTDDHVVLVTSAATLMARWSAELSDFELETIADVGQRYLRCRRNAIVTAREWAVVEQAVEGMERAQARFLARSRAG